jgi:hypothetical protein
MNVTAAGVTNACPDTGLTMATVVEEDYRAAAPGWHPGLPVGSGLPARYYAYRWRTASAPNLHFSGGGVVPPVTRIASGACGVFTTAIGGLCTPTDCTLP